VLALSLMAFILLLLLSLSTFVRVESMSSSQRMDVTVSRQNALMALNEALGELQVAAGADQRITATGGLWATPANGAEHLVGVWSSEDLDGDGAADGQFQRWLVSRVSDADARDIALGTQSQPVALNGDRFVSTDDDFVVLVGSGSVESDSTRPGSIPAVVGELKPIVADGSATSGRYGWWVGDEGSKARFNLLDPFAFDELEDDDSSAWSAPASLAESLVSQSMKGSAITALDAFEGVDLVGAPERSLQLTQGETLAQLPFIDFAGDSAERTASVKRHFHDLTARSLGLQTDAYFGGFKRDLSLLFEQTSRSYDDPASDFMQALADEGLIYTGAPGSKQTLPLVFKHALGGAAAAEIYGPSWDLLRDYYRLYKGVAAGVRDDASSRSMPAEWVHTYAPGKSWFLNSGVAGTEQEAWIRSLAEIAWRITGPLESYDTNASLNRVAPNSYQEATSLTSVPAVRATQGAYLPLLSRFTIFYSTVALPSSTGSGYDLDVVIQPFIAVHNPYNVSLEAPRMRVLQELDKFEIAVRRDDGAPGAGWDAAFPFRTGNPSASDVKFRGNVYRSASGSAGQKLGQSALFVPNGNNDPKTFGKFGRELAYRLPATDYAPGEVKLFAAAGTASFTQREVDLQEFGGGYLPQNGIYLGLPDIPLWVHPDGDPNTPRQELLKGVPGFDDVMVQIVKDSYISLAYEVFNQEMGGFDTASSFFHATEKMSGGSVVQRTLPQLESEVAGEYAEYLDLADSYSAAPVPHLVVDSFLKPMDYTERLGQPNDLSQQQRTFPNFILSNPLAASFSHSATVEREGNGMGNFIHTAGFRLSVASGGIPVQDLFDGDQGSWGRNNGRFGNKRAVLLEIPTAPLQSIGQLQHASLNPSPYYPALSIGQSFRSPYLQNASQVVNAFTDSRYASGQGFVFYDQNYLLNQVLWDGYYFSTIAPEPEDASYAASSPLLASDPYVEDLPAVVDGLMTQGGGLANSRMALLPSAVDPAIVRAELLNPLTSAKHLGVKGAFNVNSTSVRAWQAFLGGYRDLAIQYFDAESMSLNLDARLPGAAFLRHSMPSGASAESAAGVDEDLSWRGFIRLTDEELRGLAELIVAQVKARAAARGSATAPQPALGLRDFINRMPGVTGFDESGTLQAALDGSGLNSARATSNTEFKAEVYNSNGSDYWDASFELNAASAAPLSLNQGDILQAIGPAISARSDTFRIRAYGETTDALGQVSRSWCEAVVQRSAEEIRGAALGRRFEVISFRWLSPDEV
jgi:hypothetical protein